MKSFIGIELHAVLNTASKLFCPCANSFSHIENENTCPVCLGHPGTLPTLNKNAVGLALSAALAFNCRIPQVSFFDRKNYFYPDLPRSYQITQKFNPLALDGFLELENGRKIAIERIHIEEDAGRLKHFPHEGVTKIDYSRAGIPLAEIVTKPQLSSADEAHDFLSRVILILKHAGICDCKLENGSLRADINISLGDSLPDYKVEIKNVNSLNFARRAILYEEERQKALLEKGILLSSQTRRFSEKDFCTYPMRDKESVGEYRYVREPDLPGIRISKDDIESAEKRIFPSPLALLKEYGQLGISRECAEVIISCVPICEFFEELRFSHPSCVFDANLIANELAPLLSRFDAQHIPFSAKDFKRASLALEQGRLSRADLRKALLSSFTCGTPLSFEEKKAASEDEILRCLKRLIRENREVFEEFISGKTKLLGFFIGKALEECPCAKPSSLKEKLMELSEETKKGKTI